MSDGGEVVLVVEDVGEGRGEDEKEESGSRCYGVPVDLDKAVSV